MMKPWNMKYSETAENEYGHPETITVYATSPHLTIRLALADENFARRMWEFYAEGKEWRNKFFHELEIDEGDPSLTLNGYGSATRPEMVHIINGFGEFLLEHRPTITAFTLLAREITQLDNQVVVLRDNANQARKLGKEQDYTIKQHDSTIKGIRMDMDEKSWRHETAIGENTADMRLIDEQVRELEATIEDQDILVEGLLNLYEAQRLQLDHIRRRVFPRPGEQSAIEVIWNRAGQIALLTIWIAIILIGAVNLWLYFIVL